MTIECPDGYTYGSTCKLGCKSVFPLIGQSNITCEKNITAYPLKGYWNAGGTQPYCQSTKTISSLSVSNFLSLHL